MCVCVCVRKGGIRIKFVFRFGARRWNTYGASSPIFNCSPAAAIGVVVDLLFSFFAVRSLPENVDDTDDVDVCERHPDELRKIDMNNINSSKNDDFIIAIRIELELLGSCCND